MGNFNKFDLISKLSRNRNDLLEFIAGATFGVMFLCWTVWTFKLIVLS